MDRSIPKVQTNNTVGTQILYMKYIRYHRNKMLIPKVLDREYLRYFWEIIPKWDSKKNDPETAVSKWF
jgi:hypothetical protein